MTKGAVLVEILLVAVVIGLAAALALPRVGAVRDRLLVARAVNEVRGFYHQGRLAAVLGVRRVRLDLSGDSLRAVYELPGGDSVFLRRAGPSRTGVRFAASTPRLRFYPGGIAAGPGNATFVFDRGGAVDTLVTSRLGRMRRAQ